MEATPCTTYVYILLVCHYFTFRLAVIVVYTLLVYHYFTFRLAVIVVYTLLVCHYFTFRLAVIVVYTLLVCHYFTFRLAVIVVDVACISLPTSRHEIMITLRLNSNKFKFLISCVLTIVLRVQWWSIGKCLPTLDMFWAELFTFYFLTILKDARSGYTLIIGQFAVY